VKYRVLIAAVITVFSGIAFFSPVLSLEIHSNGTGGGLWSNPSTWMGGKVPDSNDTVIISMRDNVVFDVSGKEEPSCSGLKIDPEGILAFKKMPGILVLTVKGGIKSYGAIRLDTTSSETGAQELRLLPPAEITMLENSAFLVYGKPVSGNESVNIRLTAPAETRMVANDKAMIDIQNASITGIVFYIYNLDNTGNAPDERINFIGCRFLGSSRVFLQSCDTPLLKNNIFNGSSIPSDQSALYLSYCSLAQVFNNVFKGVYHSAIRAENDKDSTVNGNSVEGSVYGVYWNAGKQAMIKYNKISNCTNGVFMNATEGLLEGIIVNSCSKPFSLNSLYMQMTDCRVENTATNCFLELNNASVTLLNCNIADDQIRCTGEPATDYYAENMQYVIVKLNGNLPAGAVTVGMQTAKVSGGVPEGKADLNVRNSPAKISLDGWSPLPQSMRALTVRSWTIGKDGKVVRPPFYDLIVYAAQEGSPPKEIKQLLVEPQDKWYRPDPNEKNAAVEVNL